MPEVGEQRRRGRTGVGFWSLATVGLCLFALSVLATPYRERQAARRELAVERARLSELQQLSGELEVVVEALEDNPRYLARQIREDLGYCRPGEQPLSFAPSMSGPRMKPVRPEAVPPTRLERLAKELSKPMIKYSSLAAGLMMVAAAFIWFDAPTTRRTPRQESRR